MSDELWFSLLYDILLFYIIYTLQNKLWITGNIPQKFNSLGTMDMNTKKSQKVKVFTIVK